MGMRVVVPPAIEPLTATLAKLHTRIDGALEDDLINTWIASGRMAAESYQNRAYIERTYELTLDRFPRKTFCLPMPPLIAVEHIRYYDEDDNDEDVPAADYSIDTVSEPGRVSLNANKEWPEVELRPINGVEIRFRAGYGDQIDDIPQRVKDALLVYVTYRYYNRESEGEIPHQFYWLLWQNRVVPV